MVDRNAVLVAVDDGYAQTKLYGDLPADLVAAASEEAGDKEAGNKEAGAKSEEGAGGKKRSAPKPNAARRVRFSMRSSVRPGRYGLGSISGTGAVGCYEAEEGDQFTVSEDIEAEDTKFDGFHVSTMNRVLVNHALWAAGYGGHSVGLITGLPVADFFFDGERDEDKIAAKIGNLTRGVRLTSSDTPLAKIESVRIGCQAVAAWVDHVLDDDLEERNDPSAPIAIVDVGGRTTDVAVVIGGTSVDHARSGTENIGVLDVYGALAKAIRTEFRTRDKYPLAQMDHAVRNGTIRLWNKEHDISASVRAAVQETEGKIAREVERRLGSASTLAAVVFVGGGGALFSTIADRFPNGVMAEDPEFANARGLHKFARFKAAG